jgi:hypothetical protein
METNGAVSSVLVVLEAIEVSGKSASILVVAVCPKDC